MARRADRAKIFAPFDALKGFQEALTAKEITITPKIELSDEQKEALDYKLQHIVGHPVLTVIYYSLLEHSYLQITGKLAKIMPSSRMLQIVNTKISFDDIRDVKGDCFDDIIL